MRNARLICLGGRLFRQLTPPAENPIGHVAKPDNLPGTPPWRRLVAVIVLPDDGWTDPSDATAS